MILVRPDICGLVRMLFRRTESSNNAAIAERRRIIGWLRDRQSAWHECGPRYAHYAATCSEIAAALERGEA